MKRAHIRRFTDIGMSILLLLLMAHQLTGDKFHEWFGIAMIVLTIIHQYLNRYWYPALFKGKYNAYRIIVTVTDLSLLLSFILTAISGVSMSGYAVPFMYGILKTSLAQRLHLSFSYWSFALMGLHLGFHIPAIISQYHLRYTTKRDLRVMFIAAGAYGFSALLRNKVLEYLFFKTPFAFYSDKGTLAIIVDILLMFAFFALVGEELASLTLMLPGKKERQKNILYPILCIALAIIIGLSIAAMLEQGL